jgi:hypothetical protein
MADYYSLIKNAVARLDPSETCESRQALYERARSAQVTQLRIISPPLSESEISREQLALEEAFRRVEAEATSSARDARIPEQSDLLIAADEIGRPIARAESRPPLVQPKASASPSPTASTLDISPPMIVRGGATGRLIRYWRWHSLPPRSIVSKQISG